MDKLYIVIPAYNEEVNIQKTIQQWYPIIEKHNGGGASKMVVVNDGSTDDTWKILCRLFRIHAPSETSDKEKRRTRFFGSLRI